MQHPLADGEGNTFTDASALTETRLHVLRRQQFAAFWKGSLDGHRGGARYILGAAEIPAPLPGSKHWHISREPAGLIARSGDAMDHRVRAVSACSLSNIEKRRAQWGRVYAHTFATRFVAELSAQGRLDDFFDPATIADPVRAMAHAVYRIIFDNAPSRNAGTLFGRPALGARGGP
jgi:hypothetical protein